MKRIFIIGFVLLSLSGFAQSDNTNAHLKDDFNLTDEFNKLYKDGCEKGDFSICIVSATFAKFNIDTLGNVINLTFYESENTPPIFRKLLTSTLKTSDGNWIPSTINKKKVVSKQIILPFTYELEAGCNKKVLRYVHTDESLRIFLNEVILKNKGPLDCILMYELNVSSVD